MTPNALSPRPPRQHVSAKHVFGQKLRAPDVAAGRLALRALVQRVARDRSAPAPSTTHFDDSGKHSAMSSRHTLMSPVDTLLQTTHF